MALTTSDWITIIGASVQVITAVAIGVWQVRQNRPAPNKPPGDDSLRFDWSYYFRESWQYLLCIPISLSGIAVILMVDEPISKSFVVQLVAFSFVMLFGVVTSLLMIVVTAFRPAFMKMSRAVERWKKEADELRALTSEQPSNSTKPEQS